MGAEKTRGKDYQTRRIEHTLKLRFQSFPPETSMLTSLGFDEVQTSKSQIKVKKTYSCDHLGRPALFFEATINKDFVTMAYGMPYSHDAQIRHLRASSQLLRLLSLFGGVSIEAQGLYGFLFPALDHAEKSITLGGELLLKRHKDAQRDLAELSKKNRQLSVSSEGSSLLLMEKEREIAILQSRVAKLEEVPAPALREHLLDYLRSHRGEFDSAAFSRAIKIPSSRAEEGLESLIQSGDISMIGGSFHISQNAAKRTYAERQLGWLRLPSFPKHAPAKKG